MTTDSDPWEDRYQANKTGWDRGGINPAILDWAPGVSAGRLRVLVPGCGRGYEVEWLAARGHRVTAIDFAPSPVAELRERLASSGLAAEVMQMDVMAFAADSRFDAIYEQTCLCALAPEHWAEYARRLGGWLRPGGEMFALFMQTGREGGPPFHCGPEAMRALFPAGRWDWLTNTPVHAEHPNGYHELGFRLRLKG